MTTKTTAKIGFTLEVNNPEEARAILGGIEATIKAYVTAMRQASITEVWWEDEHMTFHQWGALVWAGGRKEEK